MVQSSRLTSVRPHADRTGVIVDNGLSPNNSPLQTPDMVAVQGLLPALAIGLTTIRGPLIMGSGDGRCPRVRPAEGRESRRARYHRSGPQAVAGRGGDTSTAQPDARPRCARL